MNKRIPIGYIWKTAADIQSGDFVKNFGKINSCQYDGEHNIIDSKTGILYRTPCVKIEYKTLLTKSTASDVLPFDAEVQILYCEENWEGFEFDFLPLYTPTEIFYPKRNNSDI